MIIEGRAGFQRSYLSPNSMQIKWDLELGTLFLLCDMAATTFLILRSFQAQGEGKTLSKRHRVTTTALADISSDSRMNYPCLWGAFGGRQVRCFLSLDLFYGICSVTSHTFTYFSFVALHSKSLKEILISNRCISGISNCPFFTQTWKLSYR